MVNLNINREYFIKVIFFTLFMMINVNFIGAVPMLYNNSDGFSTLSMQSSQSFGLTTNMSRLGGTPTDFWISGSNFLYHCNRTGSNISDGFSVSSIGVSSIWSITTNSTASATAGTPDDFWFADSNDEFIYHTNNLGTNITNGQPWSLFAGSSPNIRGMVADGGSTIYLLDTIDKFVYKWSKNLDENLTNGFPLSLSGTYTGLTMDSATHLSTLDKTNGLILHINTSGQNVTSGSRYPSSIIANPFDITTNGTDYWILDASDYFVYHLSVDRIAPDVNITFPQNNSNWSNVNLDVNYTRSDETLLESCWYSNDTYSKNTTLTSQGNITNVIWTNAKHNVTIWCNDSNGNVNKSSISFTIDTKGPIISIQSPAAQVYAINESINLNFTATDALTNINTCWFSIANSSNLSEIFTNNQTIDSCQNTTFNVTGEGLYSLTLYVNDSLNNLNNSKVNFSVSMTSPAIVINYPTDNLYLNIKNNVYFNFTATDSDGLDTCLLYGDWNGSWSSNYSWVDPTNATMNYTKVNLTDGSYITNVWCNDTVGNAGWGLNNISFIIDTTKPGISNLSTSTTTGSLVFTFDSNASDTNLDVCKYTIFNAVNLPDGSSSNVTFTCNDRTSAITTAFGTYNLTIYAYDLAGNVNLTSKSFTTSDNPSSPPGGGGGGAPPTVVSNVTDWTMETDSGTQAYQIVCQPGTKCVREKTLIFENQGASNRTISISCTGDLCEYITFTKTQVLLVPGIDVIVDVKFTMSLPETLEAKNYITNIVGKDINAAVGLSPNIVTVKTTIGTLGFFSGIINKLGSNLIIAGAPIPYLIFFFGAAIFSAVGLFLVFSKKTWGLLASLGGGFLIGVIVLAIVP